ncbi:hypothetical protein [Streptomyces sp. NPDC018833]|uniref:hypothetical protein n=1 Tax=Streptomyces sp. NPDC018833 TaxID=3365053 RepID=UPI00379CDEB3
MTAIDLEDNSLGGIAAWYSTVPTPPELLPTVCAECHRVLAPGGRILLAFKVGDRRRHLDQAYGHELSLDRLAQLDPWQFGAADWHSVREVGRRRSVNGSARTTATCLKCRSGKWCSRASLPAHSSTMTMRSARPASHEPTCPVSKELVPVSVIWSDSLLVSGDLVGAAGGGHHTWSGSVPE